MSVFGKSRRVARLGTCSRLCSNAVVDAAARKTSGLRDRFRTPIFSSLFLSKRRRAIGIEIEWSGEGSAEIGIVSSVAKANSCAVTVGQVIVQLMKGIFVQQKLKRCLEILGPPETCWAGVHLSQSTN